MKVTLTFLIICFLAMGSFLIGIGCKGQQQSESESVQQQPEPNSVQQQPEPASAQQQTLDMRETLDMHDMRTSADPEKEPLEALEEKEPLEGYMTPAESKNWLESNHYQVQKQADGNGYIITGSSDNSRLVIGDGRIVEVRKVLMTTDENGKIRVKVTGAQQ